MAWEEIATTRILCCFNIPAKAMEIENGDENGNEPGQVQQARLSTSNHDIDSYIFLSPEGDNSSQ